VPVKEQFPVAVPPAAAMERVEGHDTARRLVCPVLFVTVVDIATLPAKPEDEAGRPAAVTETKPNPPEEMVKLVALVARLTPAT